MLSQLDTFLLTVQLIKVNENLDKMIQVLSHKSFFDSKTFTIILSSSCTFILTLVSMWIQKLWHKNDTIIQKDKEFFKQIIRLHDSIEPRQLYFSAQRVINKTDQEVINQLKENIKYWEIKDKKCKSLFTSYEKILATISFKKDKLKENEIILKKAEILFGKINTYASEKTGETIRTIFS